MKGKISENIEKHLENLDAFVQYYSQHRYPNDLLGFTTDEVLNGKIPDKDFFKQQIATAKQERIKTNQRFNKCAFIG